MSVSITGKRNKLFESYKWTAVKINHWCNNHELEGMKLFNWFKKHWWHESEGCVSWGLSTALHCILNRSVTCHDTSRKTDNATEWLWQNYVHLGMECRLDCPSSHNYTIPFKSVTTNRLMSTVTESVYFASCQQSKSMATKVRCIKPHQDHSQPKMYVHIAKWPKKP